MRMLLFPLAAAMLIAAFICASPVRAESGSGSGGTPDDAIEDGIEDDIEEEIEEKLEERIDDEIEDRAEEKAREKAQEKAMERAEERIRERSETKSRRDDKGLREEKRFEKEVKKRIRHEDGDDSRLRIRVREQKESETATRGDAAAKSVSRAGLQTGLYAGGVSKSALDNAEDEAKARFEISKAAADAGRDIARDEARAAMEAALAAPGADEEAIKAAYKEAVEAADIERDEATDEAKDEYEDELDEIDEIEDDDSYDDSDDIVADVERAFAAVKDGNGDEVARGEWLLLTTRKDVAAIVKQGFAVKSIEVMNGLGAVLARLEAPESFSLPETSRAVRAETPSARVDYNHLYYPGAETPVLDEGPDEGDVPSMLMPMDGDVRGAGARIGVIDTEIDVSHPAFRGVRLIARNFVPYDEARPADHGTAVASIIAGEDEGFSGLAPRAEIIAASVFFAGASGRPSATTESLVRALDWMSETGTPIVSMSLAGPPNAVLEEAITRAAERGVIVVAAAGNEGPMARPMYPAAYEGAVAVTAVSRDKMIWRLANRGDYIDLAAPGVLVRHARSGGGYAASSGTSMAAPFVAAALAELRRGDARSAEEAFRLLMENAEDLGDPGRDSIYGAGLIRPVAN